MYLVWMALTLAVLTAGCSEKWDTTQKPIHDEEVDAAFFAGLNFKGLADVPEPTSLRPCCILGNDIGAEVGSIPVPGYEIRYTLDIDTLGTHQFNKGSLTLEPRGETRILSDEVSGILYTCRGGFIDHGPRARQRGPHPVPRVADRAHRGHRGHDSAQRRGRAAPHRRQAARPPPRARRTASGRSWPASPSGSISRPGSGTRSPPGTAGHPPRSPSGRPPSRRKTSTPTWSA